MGVFLRRGAFCLLSLFLFVSAAGAEEFLLPKEDLFPVSRLVRGMKGVARTAVRGRQVETFDVEILGVLPQTGHPRNLVLIRASGPLIERTGGIAAGMSGSPVYVKGRLVGAIGYGWGFSDHRLGLVTPAEDLLRIPRWPDRTPAFSPAPVVSSDVSPSPSPGPSSGDRTPPVSGDQGDGPASGDLPELAAPLLVQGLGDRSAAELGALLGRPWVAGGASGAAPPGLSGKTFEPGSPVGVLLAWGDVTVGSIGTVTAVDRNGRFLAFGHPFLNRGAVSFPVSAAEILDVVPSLESPFKIGNLGPLAGTLNQDRAEGISGRFGVLPPASEYSLRFEDVDTKRKELRRFQVVPDPFLRGKIAPLAMAGCLEDLWGRRGQGTGKVEIRFEGGGLARPWSRTNLFFSQTDLATEMLKEFALIHEALPLNPFQEIRPLGVHLRVEVTESPRVLTIERIEMPEDRTYSPGEKVAVTVTLRPWRKPPQKRVFQMRIPPKMRGRGEVVVRGGGIAEPEQESLQEGWRSIDSLAALIKELDAKEANQEIVVEIRGDLRKDSRDQGGEKDTGSKLLSEIKEERLKEGSLKVLRTNYYVEGLLRKSLTIRAPKKAAAGEDAEEELD